MHCAHADEPAPEEAEPDELDDGVLVVGLAGPGDEPGVAGLAEVVEVAAVVEVVVVVELDASCAA